MDLSPDEDNFQGRLLHQAALWDNLELLQELLTSGADVNARDANSRSALHAAALAERSRCLAALCEAGADLDAASDAATGGKTALHIAAERGHVENLRTLIGAGASIAAVDAAGDTPLSLAERNCHRHAAMALREARDALERERLAQHSQLRTLVTRGDVQGLRSKLAALGSAAGIVVNLTPGGASTLLYVASESGHASIVSALLEAGADGRAHPVTKYCPLYIASYHGHLDVARLLLADFPRAVQQETVEKWLPLHAACIGGHASMVTLLLEYPYPGDVMNTYTDESGEWQYNFAFDVNARDASGQTALYVACTLGNVPVVEALLGCTVPAVRINESSRPPSPPPAVVSPARAGISLGIHAIVSKLTGGSKHHQDSDTVPRIRPASLSCGRPGDSIVAACARGGHARLLRAVLAAGAPAHAAATPPANQASDLNRSSRRRSRSAAPLARSAPSPSPARGVTPDRDVPWTALAIAARARNVQIVEILLAAGASDPFGLAAAELAKAGLVDALAALLACKAYPDPDYKLNRSSISEALFCNREDSSLTYNALAPTTPVMLDWRELRCQLPSVRMAWVAKACLRVNSKLSSPKNALLALTRIDLANNELRSLPPELFALLSLRYLNAAQNKLERLPTPSDPFEDEGKKGKKAGKRPEVYSAPVLQEIYLQDNRLEELPPELFSLPSLSVLDLCNNKLQALPSQMWSAPALRDLNVALNHLRELPGPAECSSPCPAASSPSESPLPNSGTPLSSSGTPSEFNFDQSKSWSRSPSIESAESPEEEDGVIILGDRSGNAVWTEARRVHSWRGAVEPSLEPGHPSSTGSQLSSLNLSHNQFSCVPPVLACCAPQLARLNMAYNSLRSMSYVTSYPPNLRQLDLSHNEITCWPSLPQVENFGSGSDSPLSCYCSRSSARSLARPRSGSVRSQLLSAACPPRRHLRLAALRTLILANNLLTRIQLTTDDDGLNSAREASTEDDEDDWSSSSSIKGRLLFPLLSMLDVSCNLLRAVPPAIHELSNLSVLNISGNKDITDLPPQMGLLSRLWNLNTYGCSFSEPLRSMVSCGKYKSMDIVGYLKSVLQEASVYLRMKLMVVGKQGIGKTSLLECLRQESAIQHRRKPTEHWAKRMGNKSSRKNMSTVGVDIGTWVYEKQRSTRGAITFRTWDFGGQQESIQARAPGSPVIMVATHYDQVANSNLPENESPEALQRVIRTAIMGAPDADKLGLPRVLDSLEVSCNTRHNIRLLADMIYSAALTVKPPGSKQALLEQSVPASYLALEECVTSLARTLPDPVLRHAQYKQQVTQYMQSKNYRTFRDAAELHQATMFLHENGVLLHYDDATLKELYFLKPQWLCDVLAHVITVREINPFANNGIMKVEDLAHVFKASPLLSRSEEANSLVVSLLNKFELALCWDARVLLVPPLLPSAEPDQPQLPLRTRTWSRGTPRRAWPSPVLAPLDVQTNRHTDSPVLINEPWSSVSVGGRSGGRSLRRLLLVSYVPCGFWPRLAVRVLADSALALAAQALYSLPRELESDEAMAKALELNWGWKLWKTGLRLVCGDLTIVTLRSLPARSHTLLGGLLGSDEGEQPYRDVRFRVKQEGVWTELDAQSCACVEILLPAHVCVARRDDGLPIAGYQSVSLEPNPEVLAKVLAIVSDHVDLLLEDWYPSLGTRFVHTSEGRCLITRVIPCPDCMRDAQDRPEPMQNHLAQAFRRLELGAEPPRRLRLSEESRASDGDSGVGAESNASSRLGSVEGIVNPGPESPAAVVAHAWTVEECILAACSGTRLSCGIHADVALRDVAPDVLLLDVEEEKRARWEQISRSSIAGRGAFGTVLSGCWRRAGSSVPVALKALQPVPPPAPHDSAALHAYKAALSRWEREPTSAACRAYCGLRQELSVLSQLRHPHVVPLLGVCGAPLALLLELAPQGALDNILRSYAGCGARVGPRAARALALQLSRALEYLHARRIVYRDLKSENVLVWSMPRAAEATAAERSAAPIPVKVKLGDYGISRLAPPSGTKGFGGTEGFMAPEIMRYNGEEEYNEKVDCFSYGMLLYEVVTLRQPFEGHEAVKEAVLDGARPSLSARDLQYPCCLLDSMRRCWSGSPELRPSAAALVSIASAPEYSTLMDAASSRSACQSAAVATPVLAVTDCGAGGWEVWYGGGGGGEPERAHSLLASDTHFTHHHTLRIPPDKAEPVTVTAMCRVGSKVWIGDSAGRINVYSASTCAHQWGVSVREAVGGSPSPVSAVSALAGLQRVAVALQCGSRAHQWGVSVREAVGGSPSPVSAAAALAGLQRVAVALQCGRLFLVCASRPEAEGSFVLTELGTATELSCLAVVSTPTGMEVWSGGAGLHVYTVCSAGVRAAQPLAERRVALLAAHDQHVAVYCAPGACIYQWSVVTHAQTARLDCSKLVPCSESLQSIALDEQREGDRFTVTALCSLRSVLYVGTAWGCVIVADHRSLRPLTVFRPYEDEIRAMVPLASHRGAPHDMLVTFGSGYRPLLQRFAPQQNPNQSNSHSGFHCLLWRAQHWLPD